MMPARSSLALKQRSLKRILDGAAGEGGRVWKMAAKVAL